MGDPEKIDDPKSSSKSERWAFLSNIAIDPVKKAVGAAVGTLAVGLGWIVWNTADSHIKSYIGGHLISELQKESGDINKAIKAALRAELQKEEGEIVNALKDTFTKFRKSEVGSVSVGSFLLTPTSPSYTVLIYFPQKYTGKIFYQIKGNIIPDCKYVVLATPTGKPIKLEREASINLENYFGFVSQQAQQIAEIVERPILSKTLQQNLKAITFQLQLDDSRYVLAGGGSGCEPARASEPTAVIEINYVSLVAPFIQMSQ